MNKSIRYQTTLALNQTDKDQETTVLKRNENITKIEIYRRGLRSFLGAFKKEER